MTALYLGILLYLVILAFFMFYFKGFRETKSAEDFLIAGGNIGFIVGFLTFSATLFSTFTLLGMPDFFKTHGVASWVFLGFTDVFMALVLLQFGLAFREQVAKVKEKTQQHIYSLSDFFLAKYNSKSLALLVALISSLFLIPYIAVQIKGVGELFYILSDQTITADTFKLFIAITIFAYTFKSGVKAVILTDTFQVILLFIVVWLIAITLTSQAGGIVTLFTSLKESGYEQHFSAPGPKGLLDYPFLISSFIVIAIMPITQPQLSSRILMFKSNKTLKYATLSSEKGHKHFFEHFKKTPIINVGLSYGAGLATLLRGELQNKLKGINK